MPRMYIGRLLDQDFGVHCLVESLFVGSSRY
jgi:hypothetical protein